MAKRGPKPRVASNAERAAIDLAIERAGGAAELGRLARPPVSRQAVAGWRRRGVPLDQVETIGAATGVPAQALRHDHAQPR